MRELNRTDVAGPTAIQTLAAWALLFALFGMLASRIETWRDFLPWLLLLFGSIGLLFLQRWGAVLVCAIGWFGQAAFACFGIRDVAAGEVISEAAVLWAITLIGIVLLAALVHIYGRQLRNGP